MAAPAHRSSRRRAREPGSGGDAYCYNPPAAGKKIRVTAWIADKYVRREKPYIVTEAVSVDEDGRLIDRVITHELKRPREVGKKWER